MIILICNNPSHNLEKEQHLALLLLISSESLFPCHSDLLKKERTSLCSQWAGVCVTIFLQKIL